MAGRYSKGWSKEHQAVLKLYAEGRTPAEIVKETKLDMLKVRNIMRCKQFNDVRKKGIESSVVIARQLFESKLTEAAGEIVRMMKHGRPDQRLRFDAAKEVLYQCGMKPVEVIETRGREYTPEEIQSSLTVIKEVQSIEEKLAAQGSNFLVENKEASGPMAAPVPAYSADEAQEEVPPDQGRVIKTAGSARQETVPA